MNNNEQQQPLIPNSNKQNEPASLYCLNKNKAQTLCFSKSCSKQSPFICSEKSCICFQQHSKCLHISISSVKQNLYFKIISLKQFQQQIGQKVDKIIDTLSDFKDKILLKIKEDFNYFGMTKLQIQFANNLTKANTENLTGKAIWEVITNLQFSEGAKYQADRLKISFQKQLESINERISLQTKKFLNFMRQMQLKYDNESQSNSPVIFRQSKILKDKQNQLKLKQFFQKKIVYAQLLYRASQNSFQASKFFEKCKDIPNTLTICQTQFEKIIGGFTPLVWKNDGNYAYDQSGQSFIFSLTNNDKFKLQKGKQAVFRSSSTCPRFGGGYSDFGICDKANVQSQSYARINQSYYNQKYKASCQQSFSRFCGNPKCPGFSQFKVNQWQVWQLKLQK